MSFNSLSKILLNPPVQKQSGHTQHKHLVPTARQPQVLLGRRLSTPSSPQCRPYGRRPTAVLPPAAPTAAQHFTIHLVDYTDRHQHRPSSAVFVASASQSPATATTTSAQLPASAVPSATASPADEQPNADQIPASIEGQAECAQLLWRNIGQRWTVAKWRQWDRGGVSDEWRRW